MIWCCQKVNPKVSEHETSFDKENAGTLESDAKYEINLKYNLEIELSAVYLNSNSVILVSCHSQMY